MELIIKDKRSIPSMLARISELIYRCIEAGTIVVTFGRLSKSREQEKKYHALINDIAKTVNVGTKHDAVAWKALLVHAYAKELKSMGEQLRHPGRVIPSLDGEDIVSIRPSTKDFLKKEASGFIEYLYAFGSEHDAMFSEKAIEYYEETQNAS